MADSLNWAFGWDANFQIGKVLRTILATNSANHPGTGATLRTAALRIILVRDRRSAGPPIGPENMSRCSETASAANFCRYLSSSEKSILQQQFQNLGVMEPKAWLEPAPSLRIRLAIWLHESKAVNPKTFRKIPVCQTNSPIWRSSSLNTPKILKCFWPRIRPITPAPVSLFGLPLYESRLAPMFFFGWTNWFRETTP